MEQVLYKVSSDHYLMICSSCCRQPMTFPPFHQRLVCLKLFQCPLQPVEPTTVKKKVDTIMLEHDMGRAILLPVDFQEFQVILGSNKSYSR